MIVIDLISYRVSRIGYTGNSGRQKIRLINLKEKKSVVIYRVIVEEKKKNIKSKNANVFHSVPVTAKLAISVRERND